MGGRVEIRAPIGAGGMGRVYRAWHLASNTQVAVKVLAPGADQAAMARRLNVEVVAARRVDHPNVMKVLESGVDPIDGLIYVVMEYLEGKDLAQLVAGGKSLGVARACSIVRDVLEALDAAHALNVLHRDIKPGNIMLTRTKDAEGAWRDQVKVVDFGLAKLSGEFTSLTQTGFIAGTPGFMSPEQALGEDLDGRADVYACGATLYRLLAGQMPFKGEKLAAVLRAMREDPPPIAGLPAQLDRVLTWSLARERHDRCPSARAFADALAPFADDPSLAGDAPVRAPQARAAAHAVMRLDAALGLAPADDEPPARAEPTVNLRVPAAARALQTPSVEPQQPAAPQSPEPRRWPGVVLILALGAGVGALGTATVYERDHHAVVEALMRDLALGAPEEAEQGLFQQLDRLATERGAQRLAARLLALRRADQVFPFDPAFRLTPGRFEGRSADRPFVLELTRVDDWSFQATMDWPSHHVTVAVKGVWQGNEVLFVDAAPLVGSLPGYVFNETKLGFLVKAGEEVHLVGYDGTKRLPVRAVRRSTGATPAVDQPTWPAEALLTERELNAYLSHRARASKLERDGAQRLADAALAPEQLALARDELVERRRRLEAEAPLSASQLRMLDEITEALFETRLLDGKPTAVPRADVEGLARLRTKYGPLVDRMIAHQPDAFTAWAR